MVLRWGMSLQYSYRIGDKGKPWANSLDEADILRKQMFGNS